MTRTRTEWRRVEAFVHFCIAYQFAISITMWLLIIIGLITLWRLA